MPDPGMGEAVPDPYADPAASLAEMSAAATATRPHVERLLSASNSVTIVDSDDGGDVPVTNTERPAKTDAKTAVGLIMMLRETAQRLEEAPCTVRSTGGWLARQMWRAVSATKRFYDTPEGKAGRLGSWRKARLFLAAGVDSSRFKAKKYDRWCVTAETPREAAAVLRSFLAYAEANWSRDALTAERVLREAKERGVEVVTSTLRRPVHEDAPNEVRKRRYQEMQEGLRRERARTAAASPPAVACSADPARSAQAQAQAIFARWRCMESRSRPGMLWWYDSATGRSSVEAPPEVAAVLRQLSIIGGASAFNPIATGGTAKLSSLLGLAAPGAAMHGFTLGKQVPPVAPGDVCGFVGGLGASQPTLPCAKPAVAQLVSTQAGDAAASRKVPQEAAAESEWKMMPSSKYPGKKYWLNTRTNQSTWVRPAQ